MDFSNINTSKAKFDKAKAAGFAEIGRLRDGINTHRVIAGPILVETIWYPFLGRDKDNNVIQGARQVIRPVAGCVIDDMAKLDEHVTRSYMKENGASEEDIKKVRSALRPARTYRFLVFDRDADGEGKPKLRIFDYPKTVKDAIENLQAKQNQKMPTNLEYGLMWMYDIYIERTKDPKLDDMYGTKYNVSVVIDTLPFTRGVKIPTAWLEYNGDGESPFKVEDFFSEQDLAAITEFESTLDDFCKQDTPEEVLQKLEKDPIYLDAEFKFGKKQNEPMFPVLNMPDVREALVDFSKFLASGKIAEPKQLTIKSQAGVVQQKLAPSRKLEVVKSEVIEESEINEETPTEEVKEEIAVKPVVKVGLTSKISPKMASSSTISQSTVKSQVTLASQVSPNIPVKPVLKWGKKSS